MCVLLALLYKARRGSELLGHCYWCRSSSSALKETLKFTAGARPIASRAHKCPDRTTVFSKCNTSREIVPQGSWIKAAIRGTEPLIHLLHFQGPFAILRQSQARELFWCISNRIDILSTAWGIFGNVWTLLFITLLERCYWQLMSRARMPLKC